jgi:hypothetical protein
MVIHRVWRPRIGYVDNLVPILRISSRESDGIATFKIIDATTERHQQQEAGGRSDPEPNT